MKDERFNWGSCLVAILLSLAAWLVIAGIIAVVAYIAGWWT